MMLESKELLDVSEIEKLVIIKNGSNYYIASNVVDKVERVWQDIISKAPEIAEDERYLDKWFGVFEQSNGEIGYIPPQNSLAELDQGDYSYTFLEKGVQRYTLACVTKGKITDKTKTLNCILVELRNRGIDWGCDDEIWLGQDSLWG